MKGGFGYFVADSVAFDEREVSKVELVDNYGTSSGFDYIPKERIYSVGSQDSDWRTCVVGDGEVVKDQIFLVGFQIPGVKTGGKRGIGCRVVGQHGAGVRDADHILCFIGVVQVNLVDQLVAEQILDDDNVVCTRNKCCRTYLISKYISDFVGSCR